MKRILIVNDDGINASGIIRLAEAAKKHGEVWITAPLTQQSGVSQSMNYHTPFKVEKADFPIDVAGAYAVHGSPADCVRVGLYLMPQKPDIVLSGINRGYNAGADIAYSGTVGGAFEAIFQGIPAIAFSEGTDGADVITKLYLDKILEKVINTQMEPDEILNVNFPTCKPDEYKGVLWDRFISRFCNCNQHYNCTTLQDGTMSFSVESVYNGETEEGSDLRALNEHYISIVKIKNFI